MAIEDNNNQNLFGKNYNSEEEEKRNAELAAQGAIMGAGGVPALDSNVVAQVPGIGNIKNPGAFDPTNIEPVKPAGTPTTVGESISQTYNESVLADVIDRGFGQEAFQSQAPDGTPTYSIYNKRFGTLGSQVPYSEAGPEAKLQAMNFILGTGGQERPLPETPTSPVLTPEQVQNTLNEQRAAAAAAAATPAPAAPTIVSPTAGAQGQVQDIPPELPKLTPTDITGTFDDPKSPQAGSAQANFLARIGTGEALNQQEIQDYNALAASMKTTFDPATGYSREAFQAARDAQLNPPMTGLRPIDPRTGEAIIDPETGKPFSQAEVERLKAAGMTSPLPQASVPLPQAFEAKTYNQEETLARLGGRTLNEYLNAPPVRTPGISGLKTDPQGRMIPNVGQFQEQPNVAQPPAAALSSFEQASLERQQRIGGTGSFEGDSQAMQDRLRANERQPGESQADRDTRVAQGQTTGGQTKDLSFADARIRARGELAARGVKNPSASMVNDLARGMQAGEPERLATAQAEQNRPEFKGKVYTVNGVTFAQTSNGGAQVISTGTETDKESTKKMKDFEFTSQKIKEAREAYLAGDVTKANDILISAEIKQYGTDATADQFFAGSTPSVTDSGLTQQQESGIQNVMATNKITREDAIKALKEAGKLK